MSNETPLEQTRRHMDVVDKFCQTLALKLQARGQNHDASKLGPNEWPHFERETPLLKTLAYGTDAYKESLGRLKPALDHHYKENRHHPEHFENGVSDMTLVDLVEMFCDWTAASQRTKDGDPIKSIEISSARFGIPPMLESILKNTVPLLAPKEKNP